MPSPFHEAAVAAAVDDNNDFLLLSTVTAGPTNQPTSQQACLLASLHTYHTAITMTPLKHKYLYTLTAINTYIHKSSKLTTSQPRNHRTLVVVVVVCNNNAICCVS